MSASKPQLHAPDRMRLLRDAARIIISFTAGRTFQHFSSGALLQSVVERQVKEAGVHVSPATQALWSAVNCFSMKNFRNLLAYEYFRTDDRQVWRIATHSLPVLEALFAVLDQQFGPATHV